MVERSDKSALGPTQKFELVFILPLKNKKRKGLTFVINRLFVRKTILNFKVKVLDWRQS